MGGFFRRSVALGVRSGRGLAPACQHGLFGGLAELDLGFVGFQQGCSKCPLRAASAIIPARG